MSTRDWSGALVPKDSSCLVLEPGSYITKAGRSDYQVPPAMRLVSHCALKPISVKQSDDMDTDGPKEKEYLFGQVLENALASGEIQSDAIIQPIKDGRIADWDALEALFKHIVRELRINRAQNSAPTMLVVPACWGSFEIERLVQIMFEQLNVPGLYIAETPVMAAFGCGILTALVIDIGHEKTEIAPVVDSLLIKTAVQTVPIGAKHVRQHLWKLLTADQSLMTQLGGVENLTDEFVQQLMESDLCEIKAFREQAMPPLVNTVKRLPFTFNGKQYDINAARVKAFECFFDPALAGVDCMSPARLAYIVTNLVDTPEKRLALWENVLITGGVSAVRGIRERFENELGTYLAASQTSGDFQAKDCKFIKVPDYFLSYKDKGSEAAYLGGIVTAKLTLMAPSQHITKADYNEMGPSVIRFKV